MKIAINQNSGAHRRVGENYILTDEEISGYQTEGYLILNDVITEEELLFLDQWFDHFIEGKEMDRMEKDFCDMSQPYGTDFADFQLVNAMLPSHYRTELANNIFHRISENICKQLYQDGDAAMDYEQFLAKKPTKKQAEFAMHQDLGYWPKTENTWTATFSLALTDAQIENGCLYLIPGSNLEPELRPHKPKSYKEDSSDEINRDDSHTLVIESKPADELVYLPLRRGSISIHDERIVHGSGGNMTDLWRKTYIVAYRDVETIKEERAMGFTHSHNDVVEWDKIIK